MTASFDYKKIPSVVATDGIFIWRSLKILRWRHFSFI